MVRPPQPRCSAGWWESWVQIPCLAITLLGVPRAQLPRLQLQECRGGEEGGPSLPFKLPGEGRRRRGQRVWATGQWPGSVCLGQHCRPKLPSLVQTVT